MQCILCDKELEPVMETTESEEKCLQTWDATMWEASGNFGSTEFDPAYERIELLIHICDDCLKKHAAKMHAFKDGVQVPVADVLDLPESDSAPSLGRGTSSSFGSTTQRE